MLWALQVEGALRREERAAEPKYLLPGTVDKSIHLEVDMTVLLKR